MAIQRLILEGLGMKVVPCLMHLNREYVYDGKQYDLEKLFVIQDLTDGNRCPRAEGTRTSSVKSGRCWRRAKPPDIEPGSHCTHPFDCEFYRPLQQATAGRPRC